jgi:hypothetical protein
MYVFCDIGHIKRLNGWYDDQLADSRYLLMISTGLDEMTSVVTDVIGYQLMQDEERFR